LANAAPMAKEEKKFQLYDPTSIGLPSGFRLTDFSKLKG